MIKTISLMLLQIILLPLIYISKGFFKLFKLCIYTGSLILLIIGDLVCPTDTVLEAYKNSPITKRISELLGFIIIIIVILSGIRLVIDMFTF